MFLVVFVKSMAPHKVLLNHICLQIKTVGAQTYPDNVTTMITYFLYFHAYTALL